MTGIVIDALTKSFAGVPALQSISFEVKEGELISMLGPSGCGKTTTLRCIAGLETGDTGTIRIKDQLVSDFGNNYQLSPDRRDLGMVFQSYAIWPHMTVEKNVAFPLRMRGVPKAEIKAAVHEALSLVGMADYADRPSTKLSGGQQQRVAVARSLVSRPSVLLFDEPLSNLDAKLRDQTRHELRQIQQTLGVTALYVTHDQSEAMAISDRIVVMNLGRIEQIGTPMEIYRKPETAFVAEFVGATNFFGVRETQRISDDMMVGTLQNGDKIRFPARDLPGDRGSVSVRPQFCEVRAADAPPSDEYNVLSGVIKRTTFFGERHEVSIDLSGIEALAYLPLSTPFGVGDRVTLAFLPGDCVPLRE